MVKLQHVGTGADLHSHEVAYGSGSGQQSVTAMADPEDANSFWAVRAPLVSCSVAAQRMPICMQDAFDQFCKAVDCWATADEPGLQHRCTLASALLVYCQAGLLPGRKCTQAHVLRRVRSARRARR